MKAQAALWGLLAEAEAERADTRLHQIFDFGYFVTTPMIHQVTRADIKRAPSGTSGINTEAMSPPQGYIKADRSLPFTMQS